MRMALALLAVVVLTGTALGASEVAEFVERHWRRPLEPQGPPPARFSAVEASLQPETCGTCHPQQLADWRTSWHAAAMGPGVAGQLVEMVERDPAGALSCFACHAPLAEQAPLVARPGGHEKNPALDATLMPRGLVCAGCHVRQHERFGPPRRDGSLASTAPRESLPHNGATRTPAFLASEFCRSCHQFEPNGFALNGKLLENTYNEWKASRFAREGVHCQDCHMPDRRHLWLGIHDREMVGSGLTISVKTGSHRYRRGQTARVQLKVTSTRVGHAFPTYVTPQVVLRAELLDSSGRVVAGSVQEKIIGREVALDLSRELYDTRLAPGQAMTLDYRRYVDQRGLTARVSVIVHPDAFYTRFYEALLQQGAGRGEALIREALAASRRSSFTVFQRELPLS
jgi:hypothetical protein